MLLTCFSPRLIATSCWETFSRACANFSSLGVGLRGVFRGGKGRREPRRDVLLVGLVEATQRRDVVEEGLEALLVALGGGALLVGVVAKDVARLDFAVLQHVGQAKHVEGRDRQAVDAVADLVKTALDFPWRW